MRRDRLDEESSAYTRSLSCCPVISHSFELNPIPASPPTWGVVLCSVFERRNREAAFSINIPVFSMPGWIEPVEPPMQGLPSPVDEV